MQPSKQDTFGPPKPGRNVSDLGSVVRHLGTNARSLDPGYLGGRSATPQPVDDTGASQLVGGDDGDGGSSSVIGEDGDRLTLTSLANQTWSLSYVPIAETLIVHWHPDAEGGIEWKRGEHYVIDDDDRVVTIYAATLAAAGAQVGDVFSAQYLHDDSDGPASYVIDFGSAGWSYKQVALGDTADYSAPDYDDSAWSVGQAPFGNGFELGSPPTNWDANSYLWLRRTLVDVAEMKITVKVEDHCQIYANGNLVASAAPADPPESRPWYDNPFVAEITDDVLGAVVVLAIRCVDPNTEVGTPDNTYADVRIEVN